MIQVPLQWIRFQEFRLILYNLNIIAIKVILNDYDNYHNLKYFNEDACDSQVVNNQNGIGKQANQLSDSMAVYASQAGKNHSTKDFIRHFDLNCIEIYDEKYYISNYTRTL